MKMMVILSKLRHPWFTFVFVGRYPCFCSCQIVNWITLSSIVIIDILARTELSHYATVIEHMFVIKEFRHKSKGLLRLESDVFAITVTLLNHDVNYIKLRHQCHLKS